MTNNLPNPPSKVLPHLLKSAEYYRDIGASVRFHGAGFIQLKLSDTERLHFFGLPGFGPIIGDGLIHDHSFNYMSTVMFGELVHTTYMFTPDPEDGDYSLWPVVDKHSGSQIGGSLRGHLLKTGIYFMPAGSRYSFFRRLLHTAAAHTPTITYMVKFEEDAYTHPSAVATGKGPPGNAYPAVPQFTEDELWDAVGCILAPLI